MHHSDGPKATTGRVRQVQKCTYSSLQQVSLLQERIRYLVGGLGETSGPVVVGATHTETVGPRPLRIPVSSTLNLEPAEPPREWKGKLGVISSRCSGIATTISCMYTHMCDARHADRTTDFPLTNKSSSKPGTPPARFLSFRKRPISWQNATSSPAALFGPGQGSEWT